MKHRGVCRIRIAPIDRSRTDDTDRWPFFLHRPDLDRRGMRSQNDVFGDKESGLHLSRRMPFGNIEGLEIVIIQFHFWSFHHFKAQPREDMDDFIQASE